ncbi:L,D-transpeptidase family protein [bacterium]|nr:L,D-transpeptidase family protein [bacterium]
MATKRRPLHFHQGSLPGYAASHGCVRLSMSTAKLFYKESKVGDKVTIEK